VWDFGENPAAPANSFAVKAEAPEQPKTDTPKDLQKREKQ
jgi:hypothetical protein